VRQLQASESPSNLAILTLPQMKKKKKDPLQILDGLTIKKTICSDCDARTEYISVLDLLHHFAHRAALIPPWGNALEMPLFGFNFVCVFIKLWPFCSSNSFLKSNLKSF
jgi:hypothetical protein